MKTSWIILVILFSNNMQGQILKGVATNLKGEIVYLEKHTIDKDSEGLNKYIRVEYSKKDGSRFAFMTSDFSSSKTIPNTSFYDERFKTKSTVRILDNFILFEQLKNGNSFSKKKIPLEEAMVLSQGFDNFIKINFSKLESNSIELNFGVLESKDFFSLICYKKAILNNGQIEFGIKPRNKILQIFIDEIKIFYDLKNKQLKSYEGRSNILDDEGKPQVVTITYSWINQ